MSSTPAIKVYVLEREGFDYTDQIMLYTKREAAVDAMLQFALKTKCIALVYVFARQDEIDEAPLELVETIQLKSVQDDARFYMVWQKQDELGYTMTEAFNNLSIFYDTVESISINSQT